MVHFLDFKKIIHNFIIICDLTQYKYSLQIGKLKNTILIIVYDPTISF